MKQKPHIVVVGAGAFGGWTALYLRRGGARVTLVDAWGPGNARASSGGETRVIRATYGPRAVYTHMAVRALALWREHERRWKQRLLHPIGVLWLVEDDDSYEKAALPLLEGAGCRFEELSGDRVRATRQEVFFFGTPPGDARFTEEALPVWADHANHFMYGIPGNEWRGFKVADDARGPAFDPTAGERVPSPEALRSARDYLAFRFPALKDAPLVEARVCQYENSPDEHFIIDRHPAAANAWLVGGGSGHGFKHGPALGELVARLVLGDGTPDPQFRLSRFGPGPSLRG